MSVHEGLVLVWIESDRPLGLLLLTFPAHEIPLDVCDNSLALGLADLLHALTVHMEAAGSKPNLVGMGDYKTSVHRHYTVAVLVDVTVNPNELTDWEFRFEKLLHCSFQQHSLCGFEDQDVDQGEKKD